MRNFFVKNITWVYISALICFAYSTLLSAIPDQVYLTEGETLSLDVKLPVTLAVGVSTGEGKNNEDNEENEENGLTAMADLGETTYETIKQREATTGEELSLGEHVITCYLFGLFPVKQASLTVVKEREAYASGHVTGIYGKAGGVLVLGTGKVESADGSYVSPAENILNEGDYITAVNGEEIEKKEELVAAINKYGADPLILSVYRQEEKIEVSVSPVAADAESENDYMLGIWVKDDMAGIGTISYYDEEGNYGALGHGITDGQTGELLRLSEGRLYFAEILKINRGERGNPGELEGVIYYTGRNLIGSVENNTDTGIYGTLGKTYYEKSSSEDTLYRVGYKQEVQTGSAVLISDVSGEKKKYSIEIEALDYASEGNKGIRFRVDDEELIALTGGIVQGLSGSPIIQNGKLVGAVTHVLISDPTRGYGVFVENMLNDF
jgi:stage IV sporulation protein B